MSVMTQANRLLTTLALSTRELSQLVSITKSAGVNVVDWHILGQQAPGP